MLQFDPSQQRALELDPAGHARVLGAPGSGKTAVLIEAYARLRSRAGWSEGDVLVLGANRAVAAKLRSAIEARVRGPLGGTPVRTAVSLAFALLQGHAAREGHTPPRLLTGAAHDEIIAAELASDDGAQAAAALELPSEVLASEVFRAEMREFSRVLDDAGFEPSELQALLRRDQADRSVPHSRAPEPVLSSQWIAALALEARVRARLQVQRPHELTASALLRHAARLLAQGHADALPRLVLVDDAQELGEGQLALLAALARCGARVWAFGDPDTATGAFQGEASRILAGVESELLRKGAPESRVITEQLVILDTVYRHGSTVRQFAQILSSRVGTAGAGMQRAAAAAQPGGQVEFATVPSVAEQLGAVAHRLRRRKLGLDDRTPLAWRDMAVVCRSRAEVVKAARVLAAQQVPTSVRSGGVVLAEHQIVRDLIRLLRHALEIERLTPIAVVDLLGGPLTGLDPVALRRLRGEMRLQELRRARAEGRDPASATDLIADEFAHPSDRPVVDSRAGRALRRLGRLSAAAGVAARAGGTPREVLWHLWDGTGLADKLQAEAINERGARADEAHRLLDAVLGLFFELQRHEEQDSDVPIAALLTQLEASAVAVDTLAAQSDRDVVTVTTPQGLIGREFAVVSVLGPQDGAWPNLRTRGSLLGVAALERWLRGGVAEGPSRRDTMHDELRLFLQACSSAREELLAVAVADEDHYPSAFFGFGRDHAVHTPLPSTRLTLRGAVAHMRRRVVSDPRDAEAWESLVALARAGAPGAHPDEWYGVLPLSTSRPLVDREADVDALVPVSPSRIEAVERCPLDWAISQLGGSASAVTQGIGTLLHHALEHAGDTPTAEQLLDVVRSEWGGLVFDAAWESERQFTFAKEMAVGLADYLAEAARAGRMLLGREARLNMTVGGAKVRGNADRIEARERADGSVEVSVIDLKTGASRPTATELADHAQLQAYQLGLIRGAYELSDSELPEQTVNAGAKLLHVHPATRAKTGPDAGLTFREQTQPLLTDEQQAAVEARIAGAAEVMGAGSFIARVEHHCSSAYTLGTACRLHIIPSVSFE